jgi:RNA polymerase sigma-70 factor (ECF subfamily)
MDATGLPPEQNELVLKWDRATQAARERMLPLVYDELRRLAGMYLARERSAHTLQPTALVHEAYLRLVDQRRVDWGNRAQFVGIAAMMMRRVLMNHARERAAAKRDGPANAPLTIDVGHGEQQQVDLIAINHALDLLQSLDRRKSDVVELKFFGGLTTSEIAHVLRVSDATVEREWSFARAWLYDRIKSVDPLPRR